MEKYLFDFTVSYYDSDDSDESDECKIEFSEFDFPISTSIGTRLVSGENYTDAYSNLESYIKRKYNLNDKYYFNIKITDLNI